MGRSMTRDGSTSPNNNMLSCLVFITVLASSIILSQSHEPQPVNEFCKTAVEKEMCTKQVKGAKTWHEAVKNAIESTIELNNKFQKVLPEVSASFSVLSAYAEESGIKTCKDDFTNVEESLNEALGFLAKNDTASIGSFLASCNINDCEESFTGGNIQLPVSLTKGFDELHWYIDNCLAVTSQA